MYEQLSTKISSYVYCKYPARLQDSLDKSDSLSQEVDKSEDSRSFGGKDFQSQQVHVPHIRTQSANGPRTRTYPQVNGVQQVLFNRTNEITPFFLEKNWRSIGQENSFVTLNRCFLPPLESHTNPNIPPFLMKHYGEIFEGGDGAKTSRGRLNGVELEPKVLQDGTCDRFV